MKKIILFSVFVLCIVYSNSTSAYVTILGKTKGWSINEETDHVTLRCNNNQNKTCAETNDELIIIYDGNGDVDIIHYWSIAGPPNHDNGVPDGSDEEGPIKAYDVWNEPTP